MPVVLRCNRAGLGKYKSCTSDHVITLKVIIETSIELHLIRINLINLENASDNSCATVEFHQSS